MSSPLKRKARLSLEPCEAREVPAALTWTNAVGNNDFYTPGNWTTGTGPSLSAPVAGDDVTFDGTVSSADCDNLSVLVLGGGGTIGGGGGMDPIDPPGPGTTGLNSLRLINGYAGTVEILANLQVGTFVLAAASTGAISQPSGYPGNDLTVIHTFTWTSGTLNNTPSNATVNVNGGGSITPANAGTVSLGSTLIFTGTEPAPKETTIDPGTITLLGAVGGGIVVGGFATRTTTNGDIIGINKNLNGAQIIEIKENGTLGCIGPGTLNYDLPIFNKGTFNLTGSVRVNLTGGNANTYDYVNSDNAANPQLRIENGSSLTVANGMSIAGGTVFLMMNPNLPANQQTATINGRFDMTGGIILFSAPIGIGTTPLVYGTFITSAGKRLTRHAAMA